jgi:hypothetical protein
MKPFPVQKLTEADLDHIVEAAGGIRAHPDAAQRDKVGADYVVGKTVIELKILDEEGFDKPTRQAKLAELFRANQPDRPVVVVDPELLPEKDRRRYRNIVEQPIKGIIAKSKQQLEQTREEISETTGSVLWIVNNGYTALDHDTLKDIAANRVRQDTSSIDGIIVSGCYYHSDGFDGMLVWPCAYVPARLDHSFPEFDRLRDEFQAFAETYMTNLMRQTQPAGDKFEVRDLVFDVDGLRFVRPAPVLGQPSEFYVGGRPRTNSSGIEECPVVGLIVPGLKRADHALIAGVIGEPGGPLGNWPAWQRHMEGAAAAASPTKPLVSIPVDAEEWLRWCRAESENPSLTTLNRFAHTIFDERIRATLKSARERTEGGIIPSAYVLAVTQEIGQDRANDVSDIAAVRERATEGPIIRPLAENLRIFHEHAIGLAAAYALREGLDLVLWNRDRRHGWF